MGINSRPRDGRAACQQIGFCFQGCKVGAKWSTLYVEIPKAEETGNLDLRTQAHALRIETGADGKVSGVLYADKDGNQRVQKARAVCVAGVEDVDGQVALGETGFRAVLPEGADRDVHERGVHLRELFVAEASLCHTAGLPRFDQEVRSLSEP